MKSRVIAVIGHVDHGKTSLVRALTGIETDRLEEEKARGLSIALGYAHRDYPGGRIDFVDTPGHADFVRTMVAGATGAGAALLAVSACEGVAHQTREHLDIVTLLGIRTGVVAVTKSDLSLRSQWPQQEASIRAALALTGLCNAPVVFCSAITGDGLDVLHRHIAEQMQHAVSGPALPGFFLPVDRVFSVAGKGTVVTGALLGAGLSAGDEAVIAPSGRPVRVRGLQTHGSERRFVEAGSRVAVNLRSIAREDVRPGDVLCAPACFASAMQVDCLLSVLPTASGPVRHLDEVRVMFGAHSATARVRLIQGSRVEPGESSYAQLRFSRPVVAYAGQKALLRRLSPVGTIGGAVIIDPAALPSRRNDTARMAVLASALSGDFTAILEALEARSGGVISSDEVARLSCRSPDDAFKRLDPSYQSLGAGLMVQRPAIEAAMSGYLEALASLHVSAPLRPGFPDTLIRASLTASRASALLDHAERLLIQQQAIVRSGGLMRLAGYDPLSQLTGPQLAQLEALEQALLAGGLSPPHPGELCPDPQTCSDLTALLAASGRAVSLMNHALRQVLTFHVDALRQAEQSLRAAFPCPAEFRTGEARAVLGTSRKFIVPVLEYLDARGVTVRKGDLRRLAEPLPDEPI